MKKFLTSGIIIGLLFQLIIVPIGMINIASAAPVEQKSFLSLIGKEANYKSLFDKILAFDMTSQLLSRQESSATIRQSGRYVRVDDIDQVIKSGILDINGSISATDIPTDHFMNVKKSIGINRYYSYREYSGTPGITESQKSNETDEIMITGRSIDNTGIGRIWVSSGSSVYIGGNGELGQSSKWTIFYQWGKPIDHSVTQAAHNEMQRYSMGYRDLPLAPIVPELNGTPMAFMNDESQRIRDEVFYMKDGKEIPDSQVPFKKIGTIDSFDSFNTSREIIPSQDFFTSNRPFFGQICGYNEGPCGGVGVKIWETLRKTRAFPGVGSIVFKSDRNGWLYYDASFRPKAQARVYGHDLNFTISTSTTDFKTALKSIIWDSRGDPCEAADVTTDPVCKAAYGQAVTTNSPLKLSLRAESGTSSSTYYSDTLADSSDIKIINVQNGSVILKWDSNNTTACTLNNQSISTSGTQTFTGLTNSNTVHYLKCVNSSGKIASLYFKVEMNSQDCFAPGSCGQGLPSSSNPYYLYLSSANRMTMSLWIAKNITSREATLTSAKYDVFLEGVITRLKNITKNTKSQNTSIKAKYLIFELQKIQDRVQDDALFDNILDN